MTWSWGGSEVVLMTLICNSQLSISGEPTGPDETNQIKIKAQNLVCTSFYSKRFRTPSITEFELEVFTKFWIWVVFPLTIGPSLLHSSVLMRNQTNLNAEPRAFCTNKCKIADNKECLLLCNQYHLQSVPWAGHRRQRWKHSEPRRFLSNLCWTVSSPGPSKLALGRDCHQIQNWSIHRDPPEKRRSRNAQLTIYEAPKSCDFVGAAYWLWCTVHRKHSADSPQKSPWLWFLSCNSGFRRDEQVVICLEMDEMRFRLNISRERSR